MLVAAALPLVLFALGARRTRYLLPAFPMIALLAARGLEALPGRARRFAVLAAAGFSLVTVFAVYLPFLKWVNTANLQAAGRFLDERGVAAVEVTVLPAPGVAINPEVAVPLLDYHTAARIIVRAPTPPPPPQEELRASSFRFTWEQPLPSWYRADAPAPAGAAQVLITGDPAAPLPRSWRCRSPAALRTASSPATRSSATGRTSASGSRRDGSLKGPSACVGLRALLRRALSTASASEAGLATALWTAVPYRAADVRVSTAAHRRGRPRHRTAQAVTRSVARCTAPRGSPE